MSANQISSEAYIETGHILFSLSKMIEIGYWKLRGLVGGIRVLLEHVGEEWKETQYEAHFRDGQWDRTEWQNVKKSDEVQSKFAFPNIPWMKDGDVCLSQSTAILKV